MSYFPVFIKFDNKKVLIIGGGKIAYRKLKYLLEFTDKITVISNEYIKEVSELIESNSLSSTKRNYKTEDSKGFDIVIAAVDNIKLQESIYKETREYKCLYSCVDIQEYCDFIFPSYIKRGDLTIAISTSGSSPAMAKHLKIWLDKIIPSSIADFLKQMREYRTTMPKGKERMDFLDKEAKEYINNIKEEK
jgi:precorrin-2 dehydrogenase/sirohydrochlorin ferrochelatase